MNRKMLDGATRAEELSADAYGLTELAYAASDLLDLLRRDDDCDCTPYMRQRLGRVDAVIRTVAHGLEAMDEALGGLALNMTRGACDESASP